MGVFACFEYSLTLDSEPQFSVELLSDLTDDNEENEPWCIGSHTARGAAVFVSWTVQGFSRPVKDLQSEPGLFVRMISIDRGLSPQLVKKAALRTYAS